MTIRRSKKTTRGISLNAWTSASNQYACFVDENYNHRSYHNVTPASFRRVQRAQLKLMEAAT